MCLRIKPQLVPLLPGASALSEAGIKSSLYSSNADLAHALGSEQAKKLRSSYPLLADPQTSRLGCCTAVMALLRWMLTTVGGVRTADVRFPDWAAPVPCVANIKA